MKPLAYEKARDRMVESQIVGRGIADPAVVDAMRRVPRHCFVPESLRRRAYEDRPLEIGQGQTISQPYMVAVMSQLLRLQPGDSVLEVGTGSGYQTAILSRLAGRVISLERIEALAVSARARLRDLGCDNVTVTLADGTLGCPEYAPFDAIVVTAGAPRVPQALQDQLADGGRLVCPAGSRDMQRLIHIVRDGDACRESDALGCVFVPLIGEQGWEG